MKRTCIPTKALTLLFFLVSILTPNISTYAHKTDNNLPLLEKNLTLEDFEIFPELPPSFLTQGFLTVGREAIKILDKKSTSSEVLTNMLKRFDEYMYFRNIRAAQLQDYYLKNLKQPILIDGKEVNPLINKINVQKINTEIKAANKSSTKKKSWYPGFPGPLPKKLRARLEPNQYLMVQLINSTKPSLRRLSMLLKKKTLNNEEQRDLLYTYQKIFQNTISLIEQVIIEKTTAAKKEEKPEKGQAPSIEEEIEENTTDRNNTNFDNKIENFFKDLDKKMNEEINNYTGDKGLFKIIINPLAIIYLFQTLLSSESERNPKLFATLKTTIDLIKNYLPTLQDTTALSNNLIGKQISKEVINGIEEFNQKAPIGFTLEDDINKQNALNKTTNLVRIFTTNKAKGVLHNIANLAMFLIGGQELSEDTMLELEMITKLIQENAHATIANLSNIIDIGEKTFLSVSQNIYPRTAIGNLLNADATLSGQMHNKAEKLDFDPTIIHKSQNLLEKINAIEKSTLPGFNKISFTHQRFANSLQQVLPPTGGTMPHAIMQTAAKFANSIPSRLAPTTKKIKQNLKESYQIKKANIANSNLPQDKVAQIILPVEERLYKSTANQFAKAQNHFDKTYGPTLQEKYGKSQVVYGAINETISYAEHFSEHATSRWAPLFEKIDNDPKQAEKTEKINTALFWTLRLTPTALFVPALLTCAPGLRRNWHTSRSIPEFFTSTARQLGKSIITLDAIPNAIHHTLAPFSTKESKYVSQAINSPKKGKTYQIVEHFYQPRTFADQITRANLWFFNGFFTTRNIIGQTDTTRTYTYTQPPTSAWLGIKGIAAKIVPSSIGWAIGSGIATTLGTFYLASTILTTLSIAHAQAEGKNIWNGTKEHMISTMRNDLNNIATLSTYTNQLLETLEAIHGNPSIQKHYAELKKMNLEAPLFGLQEIAKDKNIFKIIQLHAQLKKILPQYLFHIGKLDLFVAQHEQLAYEKRDEPDQEEDLDLD